MKIILMALLLAFAIVLAMALLARMLKTQSQLTDLHKKLATNDDELARHRREIERMADFKEKDK